MGEAAIKGWWATPLVAAAAVVGNNRAWFVRFAGLLLLAEAVLNALIIRFVPCTIWPLLILPLIPSHNTRWWRCNALP